MASLVNSNVKDQKPNLIDIDNDGDLDLFITGPNDYTYYIENTGTKITPTFSSLNLNAITSLPYGGTKFYKPTFTDLDNDGDYDVTLGQKDGTLLYYKNTGSKSTPSYTQQTSSSSNPFYGIDAGDYSCPIFGDIDYDGDLDLLVAEKYIFYYYENTGSKTNPKYTAKAISDNPFYELYKTYQYYKTGQFVDLNGNGTNDFIYGSDNYIEYLSAEIFSASISAIGQTDICPGENVKLECASSKNIEWSNGSDSTILIATKAGYYYAIATSNYGCVDTTESIEVKEPMANLKVKGPSSSNYYVGNMLQFSVSGQQTGFSYTYNWSPTTGLSNSNISNPTVVASNTTYYITIFETNSSCEFEDSIVLTPKPLSGIFEQSVINNNLSVYPNPANNIVNIKFDSPQNASNIITLLNVVGKIVYQDIIIGNKTPLSVSNLQDGIYFLQVENEERKTVKKISIKK